MRYVIAALMGVGGILLSFGAVVFVIEIFARQADSARGLGEMSFVAIASVVIGGGLFILGFLGGRFSQRSHRSLPT